MSLVLVTRDEHVPSVAILTLNRPEAMNSYNMALHDAMVEAVKEADADPSVRVIVFTGAGRAFCAGADIPEDVLPRSLEVARDIAINCSPTSTANNKRLLRASMLGAGTLGDAPFALHMMESKMLNTAFVSADCAEGVQSFLEKRVPKFEDRQD